MDNYITLEHLDQTVWSLIQRNSQLRDEISAVDEKVNNINITESDPIFSASPAATITYNDINNWDDKISISHLSNYMQRGVDRVTAGQNTGTSVGGYATAEGQYNNAHGTYSHAEGNYTSATGLAAHAEGVHTTASGHYSHAEGYYTTAQKDYQHVFGSANILDTGSEPKGSYIEIVGNGASNTKRSNARTLDWSGNEWLAGKLTVGAGPTNDMDVATKQYVDAAGSNIFIATYNSTSYADVKAAYNAEKQILVKDGNEIAYFRSYTSGDFRFGTVGVNDSSVQKIYILQNNKWYCSSQPYTAFSVENSSSSIEPGDYLIFRDVNSLNRTCYDMNLAFGTSTTQYLANNGTWVDLPTIPTKTSQLTNDSGYITNAGVTSFNGSTGAITYTAPVTSVNGKTGAVTLTASDFGVDTSKFVKSSSNQAAENSSFSYNYYKTSNIQHSQGDIQLISNYVDSGIDTIQRSINLKLGSGILSIKSSEVSNNNISINDVGTTYIRYLIAPTADTDAANKLYVDTTVANAISNVTGGFNASVVTTLPTTNINTHTIYFVSKTGSTNDVYDEYMYINDAWEKIGNTAVDLSGYLRTTDIAAWAKAANKPTYTANEVGALPNTTTIPTKLSDLTNDAGFITSYTETDPVFAASAAAGITSTDISNWNAKVSDDKTWNGISISTTVQNVSTDYYAPVKINASQGGTAYWMKISITPTKYAIAKYDANSYLNSTTPAATDNSTKVATTAYVTTAISNAATTVTQTLTSGTAIATINGTTIYAPSYTDADEVSY